MNKLFPKIPAGEPVPCFNCSEPLTDQAPTPGGQGSYRGQYRAYCIECHMFTFFDFERVTS